MAHGHALADEAVPWRRRVGRTAPALRFGFAVVEAELGSSSSSGDDQEKGLVAQPRARCRRTVELGHDDRQTYPLASQRDQVRRRSPSAVQKQVDGSLVEVDRDRVHTGELRQPYLEPGQVAPIERLADEPQDGGIGWEGWGFRGRCGLGVGRRTAMADRASAGRETRPTTGYRAGAGRLA